MQAVDKPGSVAKKLAVIYLGPKLLWGSSGERASPDRG